MAQQRKVRSAALFFSLHNHIAIVLPLRLIVEVALHHRLKYATASTANAAPRWAVFRENAPGFAEFEALRLPVAAAAAAMTFPGFVPTVLVAAAFCGVVVTDTRRPLGGAGTTRR